MGGEGSGRKPDVLRMAREQFQNSHVEFQEVPLVMPNYSGVQKGALKGNTGLTAGSILFADADGTIAQDNSNLFWDDANNRLGIGTTSPSSTVDIVTGALNVVSITDTNADQSTKSMNLVMKSFDSDEEPVMLIFGANIVGAVNLISYGGGSGVFNAATDVSFWMADSVDTIQGTETMRINGRNRTLNLAESNDNTPSLDLSGGMFISGGALWYKGFAGTYTQLGAS